MTVVNTISKFIPNLSAKHPVFMSCCIKNTSSNEGGWEHKRTLTTAPVLTLCDSSKRIKLSTDASKDGSGAVLLQAGGEHWKPIAMLPGP